MTKPREGSTIYEMEFRAEAEMTLRDYFATKALKVCVRDVTRPDLIAGRAYAIADAMLVEREKS